MGYVRLWGDGTDRTTRLEVPTNEVPLVTKQRQQAAVWRETETLDFVVWGLKGSSRSRVVPSRILTVRELR